jgi:hypothetical protein
MLIFFSNIATLLNFEVSFLGLWWSRQQKFWFYLYPFLALYATVGFEKIFKELSYLPGFKINFRLNQKINQANINVKVILLGLIIFLGVGSPILTSIGTSQRFSNKHDLDEFRHLTQDNLLIKIIDNISKDDVIAISNTIGLTDYVITFTGAHIVYKHNIRIQWDRLNIPTQEERYNDIEIIFNTSKNIDDRLSIIKKYNITYLITDYEILNFPDNIIKNFFTTKLFNKTYFVSLINKEELLK